MACHRTQALAKIVLPHLTLRLTLVGLTFGGLLCSALASEPEFVKPISGEAQKSEVNTKDIPKGE